MPSGIQVLGVDRVVADFEKLKAKARSPEARVIFRREAGAIRDAVRAAAPRDSGALRRAIVSFVSRDRKEAGSFVSVNVSRGNAKAPHGGWVEFGTKQRRPKNKKYLAFFSKRVGHVVFVKQTRGQKPNDYFRRAVNSAGPQALDRAVTAIRELIV